MKRRKVAIPIDEILSAEVATLTRSQPFLSDSDCFTIRATEGRLQKLKVAKLMAELAKLDSAEERSLAEEGMNQEWPAY